jgi:hypothetical protein|tara:strand:- start:281 stop:424 length:144 start_codon:yes stop_codon:yes gene_type:complete
MLDRDMREIVYNILEGKDNIENYRGEEKAKIYHMMYGLQRRLRERVL